MMIFYTTIGFTWAFFCLLQSVWQFDHLSHSKTIVRLLSYTFGFVVNYLLWPITLSIGIWKYKTGRITILWKPKTAAEQAFDRWFAERSTIL